jgi:sulfoxide reductase catalytic subunit YedY
MTHIRRKKDWALPERLATPESVYANRRTVLKAMGITALGTAGLLAGLEQARGAALTVEDTLKGLAPLPARKNPAFTVERPPTPEPIVAQYNNFYEFSREKEVWELAQKLNTSPWQVSVGGLVNRPRTYDVDDLLKRMPIEERIYRLRCVEAWSAVVPWVGFPLSKLLAEVEPQSDARFVKFTTFFRPAEAPRQGRKGFFGGDEPFPYTEGLTMAEAMNEMTLLTVGSYGHVLPKQDGAPIRVIVPWKYGFKNIKSIVTIELVKEQPPTFWNILVPSEYGFQSNVDPKVPHPRWSQAFERDIGTRDRIPTQYLNGYEKQVGALYPERAKGNV